MRNKYDLLINIYSFALLTVIFLVVFNQTAKAQGGNGCGFRPGFGCPGTDYSNFGMNSNNDAATIEYDNFVSTVHSTVVRTSEGTFKVWGEMMSNDAGSLTAPTDLNSTNYPALNGVVLKVAMGSTDQDRTQGIVLSTDGLYAWSYEGMVLHDELTDSRIFQKVMIDGNSTGLPHGVEPTQVKMLFASYRVLALATCDGNVWVISQNGAMTGDGRSGVLSSVDARKWYRVTTDDLGNPFLTDIVAVRGYTSGLIALQRDGTLWTWGTSTFLGDDEPASERTRATRMVLPDP